MDSRDGRCAGLDGRPEAHEAQQLGRSRCDDIVGVFSPLLCPRVFENAQPQCGFFSPVVWKETGSTAE